MTKTEEIIKTVRGRQVCQRVDVKQWRKKMKRYKLYKAKILAQLADLDWTQEQISTWLNQPISMFKGRSPKQLMKPSTIHYFYHRWFTRGNKLTGISTI